jgi:hypothetical protein
MARFDEISDREDFQPGGGRALTFHGYQETLWIVSLAWPTRSLGRLSIVEYVDGEIKVSMGRVWIPGISEDEDGA